MSKRTRKPKPTQDDPDLAALKAARIDADILALNLFSVAVDAAKRCGAIRNRIAEAKAVGLTDLTTLEGELAEATAASLRAIDPWREAQLVANALAFKVVSQAMHPSDSEPR